jgi:protein SCO1/2
MRRIEFFLTATVACLLLISIACRSPRPASIQRYEIAGKVVSFDKARHKVTISHGDIPGYMEGMTMPFTIKDDWVYDALTPGADIKGTLVVENGMTWIENAQVTSLATDTAPAEQPGNEPVPGIAVPDFGLVNQDGLRISINRYRGRILLLTFIYTRCPLPDFCPLMTTNFSEIKTKLSEDPALASKTHLLTISIDPAYDTPKVMKEYGTKAAGLKSFDHWEFATGSAEEVRAIAQFFGLSYWPDKDQVVHSLRTALIDRDGKLVKVYRGNDWKAGDVLMDIKAIASK